MIIGYKHLPFCRNKTIFTAITVAITMSEFGLPLCSSMRDIDVILYKLTSVVFYKKCATIFL